MSRFPHESQNSDPKWGGGKVEVGILAAGRAKERVLAEDGRMFVGKVLPLSLSCDHRVVDGAEGARFLNTVVGLMEDPDKLIG